MTIPIQCTLAVSDYFPSSIIRVTHGLSTYNPSLKVEVQNIWDAQRRNNPNLFDSRILSAIQVNSGGIHAQITHYRYFFAQRIQPDLTSRLGIRPLAVSGVLHCKEGLVLGLRSSLNTQDIGCWELVPSGGISARYLRIGSLVDPIQQTLLELKEEIGLVSDHIATPIPFCLIEDTLSQTVDIGVALPAPELSAADIRKAHNMAGSREYSTLITLPLADLTGIRAIDGKPIAPISIALLNKYCEILQEQRFTFPLLAL